LIYQPHWPPLFRTPDRPILLAMTKSRSVVKAEPAAEAEYASDFAAAAGNAWGRFMHWFRFHPLPGANGEVGYTPAGTMATIVVVIAVVGVVACAAGFIIHLIPGSNDFLEMRWITAH